MKNVSLSLLFAIATELLVSAAPVDIGRFKEPVRVACVGDSITHGWGASGYAYPSQLGLMLGDKWVVQGFGSIGATLLNRGDKPFQQTGEFKNALAFKPDVVVIKLGTNDTKPQNWKFKDEFIADYKSLIDLFAKLPTKPRIFICYPAFVPSKKPGINEEAVLEEIPMIDKVAASEKVDTIDVHSALKPHPEMIPDGVHPNGGGSALIAKTVFKALTGKEYTGPVPISAKKKEP